jgi:hypothetical protein
MLSFSLAWTPQYIRGASGHNVRTRDEYSDLTFYVSSNRVKRAIAARNNMGKEKTMFSGGGSAPKLYNRKFQGSS